MAEDEGGQLHAFISYVREDASAVDRLEQYLKSRGIRTWRDTRDLWPGEDWRYKIQEAITNNSLVFIACFSHRSMARVTSYQNEELLLAIEQIRQRRPDQPWLLPVRLSDCDIPSLHIGGGRNLGDLQRVDVFGENWDVGASRLVNGIEKIMRSLTQHRRMTPQAIRVGGDVAMSATEVPWYQRAIFYQLPVGAFYDSTGDGIGDITGLVEKLDYLAWLGVDSIVVAPFYPPQWYSGLDAIDLLAVDSDHGLFDDVATLLEQAHRRKIRVIPELVLNRTSDSHPWFIESRQDRTNPKADWYLWGDDPDRFSDRRSRFVDTEPPQWAWDSQREQYCWQWPLHHQPILNFDNSDVIKATLGVVRFWLKLGFDGCCLGAVPYLFEWGSNNSENMTETHEYLRRLRKTVDAEFPGRVLLAEANQWLTDLVDYFGTGDECHMCFHFPLTPRIFMAVRKEQRHPITEILTQTPDLPGGCQWGIFLRNHDELTLDTVSDEDRDYMLAEYATDPRMRLNLGIRRRLFPLLDNDERKAELFHALLFSMPGSPVIYYGDEIGMGDNIYLGGTDGVRTPMQWSPDRNGGFSSAAFQRLYLPPLMDPVYGYQAVNVEAQQRSPVSFLHRVRDLIAIRRQHPALAIGDLEILPSGNPSVLAYLRVLHTGDGLRDETILCVSNLSRFTQPCELELGPFSGLVPVELAGGVNLPAITDLPYFFTLAPYATSWYALVPQR